MSKLNIVKKIDLTADPNNIEPLYVNKLFIGNEPNNDIIQYYIRADNSMQEDKKSNIVLANYNDLAWGDKSRRLTARKIKDLGIKTFPTYGAIGFFTYKYIDKSIILCPVNVQTRQFTAPSLAMSVQANSLTFTITPPEDITYECYRIILRCDAFAYEHITYDLSLTVPKPEVNGVYEIYCIGYENEGEAISFDSNILSLTITGGRDSFAPEASISYYTQEQIQAIIAALTDKYLREAAFVEDGTKLKFTMSDDTSFYASGKPAGGGSPQLPITIANAVVAGAKAETSSLNNTLNVVANSDVLLCVISRSTVTVPEGFELLYDIPHIESSVTTEKQYLRIYKKYYETAQEVNISVMQDSTNIAFNFFACNILNANNYIIGQIINQNIEAEEVDTVNVIKSSLNAIIIANNRYAHDDTVINAYNPSENCLLFDANARGHYIIDKSSETSHELSLKSSPSGSIYKYKIWQTVVLNIS